MNYLANQFLDKRVKLLDCQKERIVALHSTGKSIKELAAMFNVSNRLVEFTIYPERKAENLNRRKERGGWKQYYTKENHKEAAQRYRRHKKEVLK